MKKVLIISYYFPPSGGIGVLRCLKIAKYLRNFGWEPVMYTAKDAHYPSYDEGNFKDIPEGMTILKQPIFEPYTWYKKFNSLPKNANANTALAVADKKQGFRHHFAVWVRSNFFIPDARAFWVRPSVNFLTKYIKENKIDAIFSDGPPHTNTLIACLLKEKTGIPWLSDFQDPWTQVDYYQRLKLTKWANKKHHRLEQRAFKAADKMTIVSPSWKRDLEGIGAKDVSVLVWGYDEDDFNSLKVSLDKKLTLTHSGLLSYDRHPESLFAAMAELKQELEGFADTFSLQLIGQIDTQVKENIKNYGIEDMTNIILQIPRQKSLEYIASSQLTLLLLNQAENVMGRIPGKLFEYLATKRPILCLGPQGSDVDNIITESKAGCSIDYPEKEKLKTYLKKAYFEFKKMGEIKSTTQNIEQYTNFELTKKVAKLLDTLVESS
jgi:glycosyltransferase involved in cell wall biosynthesis